MKEFMSFLLSSEGGEERKEEEEEEIQEEEEANLLLDIKVNRAYGVLIWGPRNETMKRCAVSVGEMEVAGCDREPKEGGVDEGGG